MKESFRFSKVNFIILLVVSISILVLDQWSKDKIHTAFRWGESKTVIENIFALTYVRNQGAAFGLLHKAPAYFREPFFIIIPVIALFVIFFLFFRLNDDQKTSAVSLSLILSGAIGNLIDRLRYGYVIDFLDVHWKEVYHWPAFNVADSAIVVGVSILFILSFKTGNQPLSPTGPNKPTAANDGITS